MVKMIYGTKNKFIFYEPLFSLLLVLTLSLFNSHAYAQNSDKDTSKQDGKIMQFYRDVMKQKEINKQNDLNKNQSQKQDPANEYRRCQAKIESIKQQCATAGNIIQCMKIKGGGSIAYLSTFPNAPDADNYAQWVCM